MRDQGIGKGHSKKVNDWRRLPADALADRIEAVRCRAGKGEHVSQAEWDEVDRMRKRRARLLEAQGQCESASLPQLADQVHTGPQVARVSNSAAVLSDLADRIRAEHTAVVSAFSSAVQHALAAGRALIEAKDLIGHGHWTRFLKDCDLGDRQAERYTQLAHLYDANPSSGTDLTGLSIQAAIKKLSPPNPSDKVRERHSDPKPAPAIQEKLNSLAWADASPAERARFISAIGWPSLAAVLPREWLPVIQDWLQVHLPNHAAITIDLSDDRGIPTFLRRDPSAKSEVVP